MRMAGVITGLRQSSRSRPPATGQLRNCVVVRLAGRRFPTRPDRDGPVLPQSIRWRQTAAGQHREMEGGSFRETRFWQDRVFKASNQSPPWVIKWLDYSNPGSAWSWWSLYLRRVRALSATWRWPLFR